MPNEYHRGVNDLPDLARKRLQFIHLVWLVLTGGVGLAALIGGTADSALLAGLVMAALPGIVGATLLHEKVQADDLVGPFLVIGWTLLAMLGISATGVTLSPLTILFAIAPLTAMNLEKPGMAAEAAIFSAFAFLAAAVMVRIGLLPPANPTSLYQVPAMLLAFAALVMVGLLAWSFMHARQEEAALPVIAPEAVIPVRQDLSLPEESGLLLLDVSEFGRIRTLSGDMLGLDGVKAGGLLASLLQDESELSLLKPANGRTHGEITLKNGRDVAFVAEAHDEGSILVLRDLTEVRASTLETRSRLEEAEARLRGRTAFFASLGHDLKTPLNAILGYADMMRAGIRGPMPEPYKDYPEIIHESGQDLLLLVEDILDLAKAEADRQRLEPEPVDLTASAQSVLRQLENQAERAGVKLKLKATREVWAEADARAVRQIWQNLVSNAIKYSASGGTVTLDARDEGNATVLSVTDKGAGMSPEDVRSVLEPFSQGSNSKGRKGTGLGLAVVNSFAQLHGGQVVIDSAPNKGTKVEVSLPRANPADIQPLEDAAE